MFSLKKSLLGLAATGLAFCAMSAQAQVRIAGAAREGKLEQLGQAQRQGAA
jgi:hypothetical protein